MKNRIIGTLAAIIAATSLMVTASAADTTLTDESGYTVIISDVHTADGYQSFSETLTTGQGIVITDEYFFPIGGEVEYCVRTWVLPEGMAAEEGIWELPVDQCEVIGERTYRSPRNYDVWGIDGTAEEAQLYSLNSCLSEGYTIVSDAATPEDDTSDDTATGDTSDDTTGGTSDDTATGNTSDDTESDKASPDTGVEDIAAISGTLLIASSALLLSRKKK